MTIIAMLIALIVGFFAGREWADVHELPAWTPDWLIDVLNVFRFR